MNPPYTTGNGQSLNAHEWAEYRRAVYDCYFYNERKWEIQDSTRYFRGQLIHYSDFKKAERGTL